MLVHIYNTCIYLAFYQSPKSQQGASEIGISLVNGKFFTGIVKSVYPDFV